MGFEAEVSNLLIVRLLLTSKIRWIVKGSGEDEPVSSMRMLSCLRGGGESERGYTWCTVLNILKEIEEDKDGKEGAVLSIVKVLSGEEFELVLGGGSIDDLVEEGRGLEEIASLGTKVWFKVTSRLWMKASDATLLHILGTIRALIREDSRITLTTCKVDIGTAIVANSWDSN
jgi:hypothetical protein